jgi:hypothetical protein
MFEMEIAPESKHGTPYFPELYCDCCYKNEVVLFKCKICPLVFLCRECRDNRDPAKGDAPQCEGHEFFQIPGDDWKDLPKGEVNREGQTFDEWLIALHKRYLTLI